MKPVDVNPPEIHASAVEGVVSENAPVGTKVLDEDDMPIQFTVTDSDLVSKNLISFIGFGGFEVLKVCHSNRYPLICFRALRIPNPATYSS